MCDRIQEVQKITKHAANLTNSERERGMHVWGNLGSPFRPLFLSF